MKLGKVVNSNSLFCNVNIRNFEIYSIPKQFDFSINLIIIILNNIIIFLNSVIIWYDYI